MQGRIARCESMQNVKFLDTAMLTGQLIKYCEKCKITILATARWQPCRNEL